VYAVIVIVGLTNVTVGGAYVYLKWRLSQIHKVKIPGLASDVGQTMNVLLVGSDSRARLTGEEAEQAGKGEVTGERSDTIMLLRLDPHQNKALLVSIPRDLYVPISGTNHSDRVNTAFSLGGAPALIDTIQKSLGVQINHYASVDFVGFQGIVDAIGGVTVYVPAPARDDFSGLDIPTPGCVSLKGEQALAWVRSRHYQYLSHGQWIDDPRSDLGRIQRQQDFIRRTVSKAVSSGLSNPFTFNRLFGLVVNNLTVDSNMSTEDMTNLARRFRSLDPDSIDTRTLPTTDTNINGAAVLLLNGDEAKPEIDALNGKQEAPAPPAPAEGPTTTVPSVPPSAIHVRVLNGTGTEGNATKVSTALKGAGYNIVGAGNVSGPLSEDTIIRYRPGALARGLVVASAMQSKAVLQQDPNVRDADVVVVLGTGDQGVKPGLATTATTAAPLEPTPTPSDAPPKTC
jgi:LCP family protein required for cell wall assembly